jgi:hypothetical protein
MQLTYYVEQIQKLNEKKSKKNRLPRSPEYVHPPILEEKNQSNIHSMT